MSLKVICYNILRGGQFEAGNRLGQIIEFLRTQNADLIALFECDQFEANDFRIRNVFKHELNMEATIHQTHSKAHITLLFKKDLELKRALGFNRFMYHGILGAEFEIKGIPFRIIATHLNPYSSELRLIEAQVLTHIAVRSKHSLILGDFNCPPVGSSIPLQDFKSTFRARVSNHNGELDTRAIEHIQNNGFTDLWKSKNPDIEVGTYPTPLGEKNAEYPFPVRIDYLFGSEFFTQNCRSCDVLQEGLLDQTSDHFPVIAEFDW